MKRKLPALLATILLTLIFTTSALAADNAPKVYFTADISPQGLQKIYDALGQPAKGKVAVKLSFGEPGNNYHLAPMLIKDLVQSVNGTFVDSNTAYGGGRSSTARHEKTAQDHGFAAVAPVDILDSAGETALPVKGGKHLKEVLVGSHFNDYDYILVLSHFKGHAMGGFGGAIKNIAIGIASSSGKRLVHSAGRSADNAFNSGNTHDEFLEAMAEAAAGMINAKGPQNMLYISVMNNMSVDCDCDGNPAAPEIHDIGILGSLDPVALDKACVDLVYAADDKESAALKERIESRNGLHTLKHAQSLGLGGLQYKLVSLDD